MNCIEKWKRRKDDEYRAEEQQKHIEDLEAALIEIADMAAAQDDALVELAELIGE